MYYNLFQPVLHLVGKDLVNGKLQRRWDRAQTPYQRLLASGVLSPEQETRLTRLYAKTNPRQLRETIYQALARLWQKPEMQQAPRREKAPSLR